jgi:hypothetical protein
MTEHAHAPAHVTTLPDWAHQGCVAPDCVPAAHRGVLHRQDCTCGAWRFVLVVTKREEAIETGPWWTRAQPS